VAVYTEVPDDEMAAFVARYGIGDLLSAKGIAEGVSNSNFLLHTTQGFYILTLYEERVCADDLPFFIGLMEHLAQRGLVCPQVVAPLDGAAVGRLALRTVPNAARYGVVRADADGRVASMRQDSAHTGPGDINGGVYWLDRAILDYMEADGFVSLENDVFPRVIADGRLRARRYDGFFIDIGVPDDYARAQDPRLYGRGAVFFDRDGVLNADTDYVHTVEQFRWLEGAREAIRLANDRDLFAFVITNQAGVAHGLYAEAHVRALHRAMQAELRPLGAHIDDFRYCPHHPQGKVGIYRRQCGWRKPEPGMARDLCAHWPVDLSASLLIGDKDSDIAVADALGMRSLRLERDHPGVDLAGALRRALDRA